jgi:LPS export ABC transporter protein LptC
MDARKVEVLALFLAMALVSCGRQGPRVSETRIEPENLPQQEFFDSTRLSCTEDNRRLWTLTTHHLIKYRKDGRIAVDPVRIIYNTREGRSVLISDSGQISSNMDTLIASGRVKITASDGKKLTTELIAWYKLTNKVTSDRFVRLVTEDNDVYSGTGFIANTDLSEWKILHNVKARINEAGRKMQ